MTAPTVDLDKFIELTPGVLGGKPRIAGHRIRVIDVAIWHEKLGLSADSIASKHDLLLAEVYAALAYYYDHREQLGFIGNCRDSQHIWQLPRANSR